MPRSTRTAILSFLTLMLTTSALALGIAGPASAHSELTSATPADGDVLSAAPAEIVLEFNEDIQDLGNEVVVVDSEGTPVATGEPSVDGATVTQPVSGGAAGTFTVTWRVVSEDGHPVSGEFSYEVEETEPATEESEESVAATTDPTTEAAETSAPATSDASTSASAEEPASGAGSATPWLVALAVAVAAAAVIMIVRRSRAQ